MLLLCDNVNNSLLSKIMLRLGGEAMLIQWISSYNWLCFSISDRLRKDLQESPSHHLDILTWTIFEGGLTDLKVDEFLSKQSADWVYTEKAPPQPSEFLADTLKQTLNPIHQKNPKRPDNQHPPSISPNKRNKKGQQISSALHFRKTQNKL